jgi:lipopolysaccharide export system protein LptC
MAPSQTDVASTRSARVEAAFHSAHRHSARVKRLKFILPATVLLMVALFVGKSWISVPDGVSIDLSGTAIEGGRLVMSSPKLDGFTKENRAYTMTATRAIQDIGDGSRIDLEGIDAKLPFETSNWITVAARTGAYDRTANTLDLGEDVTVTTDGGVKAMLKSAKVDIASGTINTSDPVNITLEGAKLQAESMTIRDNGAVLIFDKRVRMEIVRDRLQAAVGGSGGNTHAN